MDNDARDDGNPNDTPLASNERKTHLLFWHPMAVLGGALIAAGVFAFVVLVAIDVGAETQNPYRALVTFIAVPAISAVGVILVLISVRMQIRAARRQGESTRFAMRLEPSDPGVLRTLWIFFGLVAVFVAVVVWSGTKAFEVTDSSAFCAESCHATYPQGVAYANGSHARVDCVDCHLGTGGSSWVMSNIDGLSRVIATLTDSYDRPISTPIETLRPTEETCEGCHWPEWSFGEKLINLTYYRTDEANSPWTISLLVDVGGTNPRTGEPEGIHWDMIDANKVEYIATDDELQEIAWVRATSTETGEQTVYTDPNADIGDLPETESAIRLFDCMDCHNRPSHSFEPPSAAINTEILKGNISRDLPFIRRVGLDLLNADYETQEKGLAAIAAGLVEFYRVEYPERADELASAIAQATAPLQRVYAENFFPEERTDYRAFTDNISHFVDDGCFRCHSVGLETETGQRIPSDCDTCHSIVAQGAFDQIPLLPDDLAGMEFEHPLEIGDVWQEVRCTRCHNSASGY